MKRTSIAILTAVIALAPFRVFADGPQPESPVTEATIAQRFVLRQESSRPSSLVPLYVSLAALQGYDAMQTFAGTRSGLTEANPLLAGGQPAAVLGVKAAATASSIFLAERLWRGRHRTAAVGVMLLSNGVLSAVCVRNAALVRR